VSNFGRLRITVERFALPDIYLNDDEFHRWQPYRIQLLQSGLSSWRFSDDRNLSLWTVSFMITFRTLVNVVAYEEGNGNEPVAPANPLSNWDNDALGYFGAFSFNSRTFIVTESR
jgi:hypothetical protein